MSDDIYRILGPQFEYVRMLNLETRNAITDYSDTAFRDLNERLRSGIILTTYQRKLIDLIDDAFEGVPPTQQPITIYRGIQGPFLLDAVSYVSTSHDPDIAKSFTGKHCCRLKILIPPGSHVLPIEKISNMPNEKEILLPREGQFVITNTRSEDDIQSYDLIYIPELSVPINVDTNLNKVSQQTPLGSDIEIWVQRILNLISPEEVEIFGSPEELVNSLVSSTFKDFSVPPEAVKIAILRLSNR